MFEHLKEKPQGAARPNSTALLLATLLMLVSAGVLVWGSLWLLSRLGLTNQIPPIEVSYEPYEDGLRLEDLPEVAPLPPVEAEPQLEQEPSELQVVEDR